MKRQIAVIGLGKFGHKIIETLAAKGMPVIALDRDHQAVEDVKDLATEAMQINTLDQAALEASGIREADAVIVAMGTDLESSILITTILHDLGIKEIVARAKSRLHARILEQIGATRVVFPEEDMAIRVANSIIQPSVHDYIELGGEFDLAEIEVKKGNKFIGKKIIDIDIRRNHNVNLMMIKKLQSTQSKEGVCEVHATKQLPFPDYKIERGDILLVVGDKKDLEDFGKLF
jgi:trk system potassium uptake protein